MPRQVAVPTMRTQITLQAPTYTVNTLGERVPAWEDQATVWAEATPVRARDAFAAGKEQLPVDVIFRMRHRTVGDGWRIDWRGDAYQIVGQPIDVDGRRQTLEIGAVKGVRDGR